MHEQWDSSGYFGTAGRDLRKFFEKEKLAVRPRLDWLSVPNRMRESTTPPPVPADAPRRNAVLLLEDNEIIASMLTALLKSLGLRVLWCPDGASAERLFGERHSEVLMVLADCRLPDVDGREVCARFRTRVPELPVLVTSGSVSGRGVAPLERNRFVEYLPKPYAPVEVLTRVRRLVDAAGIQGVLNAGMV